MRRLKAFVQSLYICETTIKNLRKFYYKAISVVVVVDGGGGGDAVIVAIVLLLLLLLVMRHGLTENDGRQQQSCRVARPSSNKSMSENGRNALCTCAE
jgi:hypothetical protein